MNYTSIVQYYIEKIKAFLLFAIILIHSPQLTFFAKYKLYKSEWRKYFKLHYFSVTYQNLMAHVMGITILYIKCIYRHHSINSMDDDSNWCLHTNKKNAISRTFVIFQFLWGCAQFKKVWNYIYPQCIRNITL